MKQTNTGGFTLIELLVVIAIIGILASVVLASLNTARDKGSDAAAKASFNSLHNQMALYFDNNGGIYTGACTTDTNVISAMNGAKTAIAPTVTIGGLGDGECFESVAGDAWAAWVNLKADAGNAWCIDSTGKAEVVVSQDSTGVDLSLCP